MKKNLLLSNIAKKLKKCGRPTNWVGYLRPDEIMVLIEAGAKPHNENAYENAKCRKLIGDCVSTWFYFTPSKEITKYCDAEWFKFT